MKDFSNLLYDIHVINKTYEFRQQNAIYIPVKQISEQVPIEVLVIECEHENCTVNDDIPTCDRCGEVNSKFDWDNYYADKYENSLLAKGFNL